MQQTCTKGELNKAQLGGKNVILGIVQEMKIRPNYKKIYPLILAWRPDLVLINK